MASDLIHNFMSKNNTQTQTASETPEVSQVPDYYRVKIVETGARLFSDEYQTFNVERLHFATLEEVREALKERYGKAKRSKMYCDPDREHCGYIYAFRNADWSHAPVEKWNQRDWVSVSAINQDTVIP